MSSFFVTSWTVACQAPLTMGFFRKEYCSGLPFVCRGSSQWIEPELPALVGRFFTTEPPGKPLMIINITLFQTVFQPKLSPVTTPLSFEFICNKSSCTSKRLSIFPLKTLGLDLHILSSGLQVLLRYEVKMGTSSQMTSRYLTMEYFI